MADESGFISTCLTCDAVASESTKKQCNYGERCPFCKVCGALADNEAKEKCNHGIRCPFQVIVIEKDPLNTSAELYARHFTVEGQRISEADTQPIDIQEQED